MLSFAEVERDRIGTSWDDAQRKAVGRGIHTATQAPTGYRKGRDRRLRVDPRTAPRIREAFAMRARGATRPEVGRYLRDHQIRTAQGTSVWTNSPVRQLLENRAYQLAPRTYVFPTTSASSPDSTAECSPPEVQLDRHGDRAAAADDARRPRRLPHVR